MTDGRQVEPNFKQPRLKKKGRTRVKAVSDRKAAADAYYAEQCIEVALRSHGDCELVTPACVGAATEVHHVKMRSQGGTHALDNLRAACRPCHQYAHLNRNVARENGWIA